MKKCWLISNGFQVLEIQLIETGCQSKNWDESKSGWKYQSKSNISSSISFLYSIFLSWPFSMLAFASEKKLNLDMFIDWIKQKTYCMPSSSCKRKELCCRNHRWKMFCPRGWRADTFLSRQCCSRCCNWPTPLPMSTCNLVKKIVFVLKPARLTRIAKPVKNQS